MVRAAPSQTSFNGGEWSPHLWGRQEGVEPYENSCREVTNFDVLVQGPARFRSGFRYMRRNPDTANIADMARMIRFEFGVEQPYVIEFGDEEVNFYRDRAALTETAQNIVDVTQADPAVVEITAHGLSNGDEVFISGISGMPELNNRFFLIANVTTDTFELVGLDSTGYEAYVSGGTAARVYKKASPYTEDQVFDINFTQSADVLFLVHPGVKPQQLVRSDDTDWDFSAFNLKDGPYKDENTTATTLGLSGTSGSVTVTASSATGINNDTGFQTTDVGRLIRFKDASGNWTWLEITARASTTSVTATIKGPNASAGTAVTTWRLGAFSDTEGWPSVVVFFQDRLVFLEAPGEPLGVFLSKRGDYDNFEPSDASGDVFADSAISLYLVSNTVNKAFWAIPLGNDLVIGTASSEWTIGANTAGEALTAVTAVAKESTTFGSAPIRAIKVNNTALFVGATQTAIGRVAYNFENDAYDAQDMNLFANHILRGGVRQTAYMREPENRFFVVTKNGELLTMAYKPDQNVSGWARIRTNGRVLSCAVIPSTNGGTNELYVLVEREIDGVKYRFAEVQDNPFDIDQNIENAHFLDAAVKFDGRSEPAANLTISAATGAVTITADASVFGIASIDDDIRIGDNLARITAVNSGTEIEATVLSDYTMPLSAIAGEWELLRRVDSVDRLWHLEGSTVSLIADGATHPDRTVENGVIELDDKYHVVHIGLPYTGRIVSKMFNAGSQTGTAQGRIKRINRCILHLLDTLGGFFGVTSYNLKDTSRMDEMQFRSVDDRMDQTPGTRSGFFEEAWPGGYDRNGSVVIEQRQALPMTVISVLPDMTTYEGE